MVLGKDLGLTLVAIVCAAVTSPASPALSQGAARPSFDCAKASRPDERAICDDPRLAEMDQAASIAFAQVSAADKANARKGGATFLAARQRCGADRLCILDQQVAALQGYDAFGPQIPVPPWVGSYRLSLFERGGREPSPGLPATVGRCTRTRITAISDRFGAALKPPTGTADDTGTAITFADQGHQVSYGYDPSVARSAVGDDILLCLVSVPQNCPKGDDRGRIYSATNLRTKGSWEMPDAQHSCGGA